MLPCRPALLQFVISFIQDNLDFHNAENIWLWLRRCHGKLPYNTARVRSATSKRRELHSLRTHCVARRHELQIKARLAYHTARRRPLITKQAVSYVIHWNLQETPYTLANYTQTGFLRSPNVALRYKQRTEFFLFYFHELCVEFYQHALSNSKKHVNSKKPDELFSLLLPSWTCVSSRNNKRALCTHSNGFCVE